MSVSSIDVEETVRSYTSLFGMERIDTYTFSFLTQYLRLGDLQLHEEGLRATLYRTR